MINTTPPPPQNLGHCFSNTSKHTNTIKTCERCNIRIRYTFFYHKWLLYNENTYDGNVDDIISCEEQIMNEALK